MKSTLVHLIACCLIIPQLLKAQNAETAYVSVNHIKTAYKVAGLANRKEGKPIIIFESGLGMGGGNFEPVFPYLPKEAAYFVYDRNGIGQSEPDSSLKTDADVVEKLHLILQQLDIKPPYLLAGHSLGGAFIRLFESKYPNEVSGLVFIDPTDFMLTKEANELARAKSESAIGYQDLWVKMLTEMGADNNMPEGFRMEIERERLGSSGSFFKEYQELPAISNVPVAVLIAYNRRIEKFEQESSVKFGINIRPWFDAFDKIRIENYSGMIARNAHSFLMLLPEYSHGIHNQDPELAGAVISRIYYKS